MAKQKFNLKFILKCSIELTDEYALYKCILNSWCVKESFEK